MSAYCFGFLFIVSQLNEIKECVKVLSPCPLFSALVFSFSGVGDDPFLPRGFSFTMWLSFLAHVFTSE